MATFREGQDISNQRVHVCATFDQQGDNAGKSVMMSVSNDIRDADDIILDPMLVYDIYTDDKTNEEKRKYTTNYTEDEWDKIEKASNKDGDAMVVNGDLVENPNGVGLVVDTDTLTTPDKAFDETEHRKNTIHARSLDDTFENDTMFNSARKIKEDFKQQQEQERLDRQVEDMREKKGNIQIATPQKTQDKPEINNKSFLERMKSKEQGLGKSNGANIPEHMRKGVQGAQRRPVSDGPDL